MPVVKIDLTPKTENRTVSHYTNKVLNKITSILIVLVPIEVVFAGVVNCIDLFGRLSDPSVETPSVSEGSVFGVVESVLNNLTGGAIVRGGFDDFQTRIETHRYTSYSKEGTSPLSIFGARLSIEEARSMLKTDSSPSSIASGSDMKVLKWKFWALTGRALRDRHSFLQWSAINFFYKKSEAVASTQLYLRLTSPVGAQYLFVAEVMAPHQLDWVTIYMKDFKAISPGNGLNLVEMIQAGYSLESYAFVLHGRLKPGETMPTSIHFDFDLPDTANPVEHLSLADLNTFPLRTSKGELLDESEFRSALSVFFRSMKDQANQQRAVRAVLGGEDNLRNELQKFGWTAKDKLDRKITIGGLLLGSFAFRDIPIETGDFSQLHGTYGHHAQFLAGFYGLDSRQVEVVSTFIQHFIAERRGTPTAFANWSLWAILFDSRGISVHGNRFWRDLIESNRSP